MSQNLFASAAFEASDLKTSVTQCCAAINQQLSQQRPDAIADLVVAFVAGFSGAEFENALPRVKDLTGGKVVVAVTCQSLVASGKELENAQGVSMWAASFDSGSVVPMVLDVHHAHEQTEIAGLPEDGWEDTEPLAPEEKGKNGPVLMMFSEAYSFPADAMLAKINAIYPNVKVFGGVADAGPHPQEARLMLNQTTYSQGAIGVRISGVTVKTVVSQGCRPIGDPYVVTQAERNEVQALGGRPAFEVLKNIYATLPTQDQSRVENGLHLGIAMTELKDKFQFGDFLIRNVIGIDEASATIRVSDYIRKGRTVQFHIRDQASASAELKSLLAALKVRTKQSVWPAALVFTCNGRGGRLFESNHHDAAMVRELCGSDALAGLFAAGEFGWVGEANFVHGFTASIALFE